MATTIDNPKRARQLARAIASDLTLYHEAKILEGISGDTLFDVMKEEIDQLREEIERRDTGQRAVLRAEHARGATP